tara:strand:+ start:188 stop:1645 length:1458 start_codon:yes stop_codon:yes gene_type:complete
MYKNIFDYSISAYFLALLGFITLPFYTRFLTPGDYGILAIFLVYGTTVCTFFSFGLSNATSRYFFKYGNSDYFKKLNFTNFIIIIFSLLLTAFIGSNLSKLISKILFVNRVEAEILNLSLIFGSLGILQSFLSGLLIAQQRSSIYSKIVIFGAIVEVSLSIIMILSFDLTYFARIYSLIIMQVMMLVLLIILQRNYFKTNFSIKSLKESLKFSLPSLPKEIIGLVEESLNKIMLANLQTISSLGYYQVGINLSKHNSKLIKTVSRAWGPVFYNYAEGSGQNKKQKIVGKYYEVIFLYALTTSFFIAFSEELIKILTTVDFYPAMYIVPLAVLNIFFIQSLTTISKAQIGFSEKMVYLLPGAIIALIVHFSLNLFFIPIYGPIGAVLSGIIAAIISNLITFYYGQKLYPLKIYYKSLISIVTIIISFIIIIFYIMSIDISWYNKILFKSLILLFNLYFIYKIVEQHLKNNFDFKKSLINNLRNIIR